MQGIDDKDRKILDILEQHSDYTTRKIAKATNLPITTVHNRIRKLKETGVIRRYTILKDYEKLGNPIAAFILIEVSLRDLKDKRMSQADLVRKLKNLPFVEQAAIVTGTSDIVLKVRLATIKDLNTVLLEKIQGAEGVARSQTLIILNES